MMKDVLTIKLTYQYGEDFNDVVTIQKVITKDLLNQNKFNIVGAWAEENWNLLKNAIPRWEESVNKTL